MPPLIAAGTFVLLIMGLFRVDRDRQARTSRALWIPTAWLFLAACRPVSQWLGSGASIEAVDQALEGDSLERGIHLAFIAAATIILFKRGADVRILMRMNGPCLLFFAYCALSVVWSDYPGVSLRRWMKSVGDLMVVFVLLTERDRAMAIRQLLARFGFVLMPTSVLLVKYYPSLGVTYSRGGDVVRYVGVATDKNFLGLICLIAGLGCAWRLVEAFKIRRDQRNGRSMAAQAAVLVMAFWLFVRADSLTALAGFALATCVMVTISVPIVSRHRVLLHLIVVSVLFVAWAIVFLNLGGAELKGELGRDATLTERTVLWENLIGMTEHPLLGTGFESFWLGARLERLWQLHWWRPNEAHNGYLEVFLNLGWVGVGLLALLIVTSFRNVATAYRHDQSLGRLRAAIFVATIVYGLTEAAFRLLNPLWILFLWASAAIPYSVTLRGVTSTRGRLALEPLPTASR